MSQDANTERSSTPRPAPAAEGDVGLELDGRREERALLERWREARDEAALVRLVERMRPLLFVVARRYASAAVPIDELVAAGRVGLFEAIARFDPDREVRLGSYAIHWVRARVLDCLAQEGRRGASLDAPVGGGESLTLAETIADDGPDLEAELAAAGARARVASLLASLLGRLDARERLVVERRWLASAPVTFAALGRELGLSGERARQIEAEALGKLRAALRREGLGAPDLLAA